MGNYLDENIVYTHGLPDSQLFFWLNSWYHLCGHMILTTKVHEE